MRIVICALLLITLFLIGCSITRPVAVTNNALTYVTKEYQISDNLRGIFKTYKVQEPLTGRASQTGILFFPPSDYDAGIWKAAQAAGITKIASVDYKVSWYIFYTKWETIVTGEK